MKHWKLTDFMSLMLLTLFAICILLVLLSGAKVYRDLTDRGEVGFQQRTATQYIANRVRQGDKAGGIRVTEFYGLDCLELWEEIGGEEYLTCVYCYDGYLRELFCRRGSRFGPEAGEKILEARELILSLEDGLLTTRVTLPDGSVRELSLYLRSEEAGK